MPIKHPWQLLIMYLTFTSIRYHHKDHQSVIRVHAFCGKNGMDGIVLKPEETQAEIVFLFSHTYFLHLKHQLLWTLSSTVSRLPEQSPCSWNCSIQLQDFKNSASHVMFFLSFLGFLSIDLWILLVSRIHRLLRSMHIIWRDIWPSVMVSSF